MEIEKLRVNKSLENPKLDRTLLLEKLEILENYELRLRISESKLAPEEKRLIEAKIKANNATEKLELKNMALEMVKQVAEQNAKLLSGGTRPPARIVDIHKCIAINHFLHFSE